MSLLDRYPTLRRVVVTTKTDKSFRGILRRKRRGYLVLMNVEMLKGRGEATKMVGEVVIESSNVDFIQIVG